MARLWLTSPKPEPEPEGRHRAPDGEPGRIGRGEPLTRGAASDGPGKHAKDDDDTEES